MKANRSLILGSAALLVALLGVFYLATLLYSARAATSSSSFDEKVGTAATDVSQGVKNARQTALTKIELLWQRIDERRLKNRTRDELVAWVIMGLLVAGLLYRFTQLNQVVAFFFGLIGSFIGGVVAHLTQIDLGFGPVLIRYEDLFCALIGGVLILVIARLVAKRREAKK